MVAAAVAVGDAVAFAVAVGVAVAAAVGDAVTVPVGAAVGVAVAIAVPVGVAVGPPRLMIGATAEPPPPLQPASDAPAATTSVKTRRETE